MKHIKVKSLAIGCCLLSLSACQSTNNRVGHGLTTAARGVGHLVLSPFQIAAGLLEGISSVPLMISSSIHDINKGMVKAQNKITLNDTYDSAYGKRLAEVPDDGNTGEIFYRMKHATLQLQKVLKEYGVEESEHYILTSVDTANSKGYTLFAVVYRPTQEIDVIDKYNHRSKRNYSHTDRMFYDAYRVDDQQKKLDVVVDWAGIPRESIKDQKGQAVLITLAANSIVEKKRRNEYWEVEQRWIQGQYLEICENQSENVKEKMNIRKVRTPNE